MSADKSRITQLDGLRGCAIAAVFLHHAYQVKLLWMGVDLFFVLSGFLITGILIGQKDRTFGKYIGGFYERRVRRILPPYVLLLIVAVVALHGPWMRYWYLYFGAMNFISPMRLDYSAASISLWSLAIEEQFYFLWPVAVFFMNRRQVLRCAVGMVVLAPVLRFVCTPFFSNSAWVYEMLPFRMDTLAAGAVLALVWPELRERLEESRGLRWRIAGGCVAVATVSLAGVLILRRFGVSTDANTRVGNTFIYEATLGMMGSAFVLALIGVGRGVLTAWPLIWLGRISYSFYLIHQTALFFLPQMHGLAALAGAIAYATASWFLVEQPILTARRPKRSILAPEGSLPGGATRLVGDDLAVLQNGHHQDAA